MPAETKETTLTKAQERRKWALEIAAALLESDMDCLNVGDDLDEDEQDKRRDAVRNIAKSLMRRSRQVGKK